MKKCKIIFEKKLLPVESSSHISLSNTVNCTVSKKSFCPKKWSCSVVVSDVHRIQYDDYIVSALMNYYSFHSLHQPTYKILLTTRRVLSRVLSKCCQIHKGQKANTRRDLCQGIHSKKHPSKYYSLKHVNKNGTPMQTILY